MNGLELELPTRETSEDAGRLIRILSPLVARGDGEPAGVHLSLDEAGGHAEIPKHALALFLEVLGQLANGNAVSIVPVHAELTTQQAADLLNVSQRHILKLLEANELNCKMADGHPRLRTDDVLRYKRRRDEESRRAVAELTALGQEIGA